MFNDFFIFSYLIILGLLLSFAIVYSGLVVFCFWVENKIGFRFYCILFVLVSLLLVVILIIYFFNYCYDGL